jgi:hypothetical protein
MKLAYDFRMDANGLPPPTLPGFFPGRVFLLAADRFTGAIPGIAHHVTYFVNEHLRFPNPAMPAPEAAPAESPATHRMFCCDLEFIAERFQREAAMAFMEELRRHTQAKCLIIGGAWPGHGPHRVWNDAKVMENLRGHSSDMARLLMVQLPLYKVAGVLTCHVGANKPEDFDAATEKAVLLGNFLDDYAPGLERALWLNGHYADGTEWTPAECVRFLDAAWDRWDSFALYHGVTVGTNLGNEISRRLA